MSTFKTIKKIIKAPAHALIHVCANIIGAERKTAGMLCSMEDVPSDVRVCLVPGARLFKNKPDQLTPMLIRRMNEVIKFHEQRPDMSFVISGIGYGSESCDAPLMVEYLKEHSDIAEDQLILHNEGNITYDSVIYMKQLMQGEPFCVLTAKFHMPRTLYYCRGLGLDVYGISVPEEGSDMNKKHYRREEKAIIKAWFLLNFTKRR